MHEKIPIEQWVLWCLNISTSCHGLLKISQTFSSSWCYLLAMGFFNSCWETLIQLASYGHVLDGSFGNEQQQPLDLPSHHGTDVLSSSGVSFKVPGTNFTCIYPTMNGYRACNNPRDRSCWLRGRSRGDVYDINTPCEYGHTDRHFHN